jgi:tryptophan 2,3-dioxygenase
VSTLLDDAIKDWGERTGTRKVKGKRGRNICGGSYSKPAPQQTPANKSRLLRTINKAPEVLVKISGGGKDMGSIKAHLDYISRNGEVELEDEQGRINLGKEDVRLIRDDWKGSGIPYENGHRKEAFNIVLSMPPNTDRAAVKNAAREFAKHLFEGHQYAFAAHDDEKHPHVHLVVKAVNREGIRLNPRKADLQHWRETFAEKLQDFGIEANATPRQARGVVRRPDKQALRHIQKDFKAGKRDKPARVAVAQAKAVLDEVNNTAQHQNPAQANIVARRQKTLAAYKNVVAVLAKGDQQDRELAVKTLDFVQKMPQQQTRHEKTVARIKQQGAVVRGATHLAETTFPSQQKNKDQER